MKSTPLLSAFRVIGSLMIRQSGLNEGHTIIGKPRSGELSPQEAEAFEKAGISVPLDVLFYPKLKLKGSGRIIHSYNSSRSTKRNNSCVFFSNNSYGLVQKIVHHTTWSKQFVVLKPLYPAPAITLSDDPVTHVTVKHIRAFTLPE